MGSGGENIFLNDLHILHTVVGETGLAKVGCRTVEGECLAAWELPFTFRRRLTLNPQGTTWSTPATHGPRPEPRSQAPVSELLFVCAHVFICLCARACARMRVANTPALSALLTTC